jgi:hypothetical protein
MPLWASAGALLLRIPDPQDMAYGYIRTYVIWGTETKNEG